MSGKCANELPMHIKASKPPFGFSIKASFKCNQFPSSITGKQTPIKVANYLTDYLAEYLIKLADNGCCQGYLMSF